MIKQSVDSSNGPKTRLIAVAPDFHKRILFSDEAHFWLNGYVNKQNCRIWSEVNPQVYVETPLHPEKLTVWCALWAGGIIGPYFFKNDEGHNVTVNGDRYRAMIANFFIPELNNHDVQELWFQQDGATCHTARATIDLLKDTFGDRLISRFGPVNWPPSSCNLTPLDYFLWGYVKSLVYAKKPQTLDHLEDNIRRVIADIRPQMLEKVIENWTSILDYIRASRGSHMPEFVFKSTHTGETTTSLDETINAVLQKSFPSDSEEKDNIFQKNYRHAARTAYPSFFDPSFSYDEVNTMVSMLKLNKSPGPDSISNEIIKQFHLAFSSFLHKLFNVCLGLGIFPRIWKLAHRVAKLQLGSTSAIHCLERGCPQGSVSGPIFWNIIINDLLSKLNNLACCEIIAFADDILVCSQGRDISETFLHAQEALNFASDWSKSFKLEFNPDKTRFMAIEKRNVCYYAFQLYLDGTPLTMVKQMKYLGVLLDTKYSWKQHLSYISEKCDKLQRGLNRIARNTFGINFNVHSLIYKQGIEPFILDGSRVWGEALKRKMNSKYLRRIQRRILLRVIWGYRTISYDSVYAISGFPPIDITILHDIAFRENLSASSISNYDCILYLHFYPSSFKEECHQYCSI
ncbi:retrovirus-related Pol polyprotein from type-1 retrotransposable element R1 [Trichonephila clavipes]|nr:retrovirus-related Pol polyprotein from type-1 retrotransposable element R1 [Trichonephila clavipes]